MNRLVCLCRCVRKEAVGVFFSNEVRELVVSAIDESFAYECPFADVYPLSKVINSLVCQCVSLYDVFRQEEFNAFCTFWFAFRFE